MSIKFYVCVCVCLYLCALLVFLVELNREKCPHTCYCHDDQVNCTHQSLVQIPKYLPFNTATLNLSYNNLTILNVSDLIIYSQLRQLILNHNQITDIIETKVSADQHVPTKM